MTGGGSGIGLAVARRLRAFGPVVLADRDKETLVQAETEGFDCYQMDVSRTEAWQGLNEYLLQGYGRLNALVHNAGVAPIARLVDTDDELIDLTYATNVRSVLVGTRELWNLITQSRANIVNIASVAAVVGQDRSAAYVASKGAVVAVTRALAIELAPYGVRANSVCPGTTMTPMLEHHFASIPSGDEAKEHTIRRHPLGRLLVADDIAPSVVHLLWNETAGGMTGSNIVVDGGLTATFDYGNSFAGGARVDD